MARDLFPLGETPPLGEVPPKMHAFVVRQDRFGPPRESLRHEVLPTPAIAEDEVLVYVMAAGINYNNVWASLGSPVDVIAARRKAGEREDFHVGGSDASGIVYRVGRDVTTVRVGDEVVVHCGTWNRDSPEAKPGRDPMFAPSFRIWGYETNWGSFAQFTRVQAHQCLPKPKHLTWEAAAAYMLVGATAYRMLLGFPPNVVKKDEVVLVWGGAGGLGSMAIQIARALGAVPVAVVSSRDKFRYCIDLGARGCVNRAEFDHWGMLPHWKDSVGYNSWLKGVRKFGKAVWDVIGDRRNPTIVFEHPGESTIPTSIFVCESGGMVVICAGTTGYNATVDLRYLWMRQKRLQGSHFANDEQARGINDLVSEGLVDPCLSRTFRFDEIPAAHQLMYENKHPHGNMAVLVGARALGTGVNDTSRVRAAPAVPALLVARAARVSAPPVGEPAPLGEPARDDTPVGAIMRPGVISCSPETTVEDVIKLLVLHRIHAVFVVDPVGAPLGVVSQTDIVLARQGRTDAETRQLTAGAIMTVGCITCSPETPVSRAVTILMRHRVHRLVVTDDTGPEPRRPRMVGVLSLTDVVNRTLGFRED